VSAKLSPGGRARLGRLVFFGWLALALLAPMASDRLIPATADLAPNIGLTVQARMALEEGQFPLRVAPWEFGGLRYPIFQFYGQLPYTLSGALHAWVFRDNAYVPLKLLVWLALLLGGLAFDALARYLGAAWHAALVAAVAYVAAPYLLINLHARGALAEVMAQGLLPLTLLSLLRYMVAGGRRRFVWAALACAALLATHLITSFYNLAAAGLLGLALAWSSPRRTRRLLRGLAVAAMAGTLSLWFLLPIQASSHFLALGAPPTSPAEWAWLTPLSGLLAPTSVPPVPRGNFNLPWQVHPAVGLPLLCGAALSLAFWFYGPLPGTRARLRGPIGALLALFALGLLLAWSPFDLWRALPRSLSLAQFPYRLLTLCMWSAGLLLALSLSALVPRTNGALTVAVGCVATLMSAGPYLATEPSLQPEDEPLSSEPAPLQNVRDGLAFVQRRPTQGYATGAYGPRLWTYGADRTDTLIEIGEPPPSPIKRRLYGQALLRRLRARDQRLLLTGESRATEPTSVEFRAGERVLAQAFVPPGSFSLALPVSRWSGAEPEPFEARVLASAGEAAHLSAVLADAELAVAPIAAPPAVGGSYARAETSTLQGDRVVLTHLSEREELLVLPVILAPGLLDVRLDGVPHPYAAFSRLDLTLTYVRVPPGRHVVSARFVGSRPGNLASAAAFLGLLGLAVLGPLWRLVRRPGGAHP